MQSNQFELKKNNAKNLKIAIVCSRFNFEITNNLLEGALAALEELGLAQNKIKIIQVPGAFEIPLACQKLALTKKYSGIIALGALIKGETAHFDYIAQGATSGIMRVMLDKNLPISFGVITVNNLAQAVERSGKNKKNKGREAALSLVEMINVLK